MTQPIYTAFFTEGTLYEAEARRLRNSLETHGLPYDIRPVRNRGDWQKNTHFTATHICNMLEKYSDRPVIQLDADAVMWEKPRIFHDGTLDDFDVAVHYRKGHELLNGTAYFAPTDEAKAVAQKYKELIDGSPNCHNEQTMLAKSIEQLNGSTRLFRLPPGYCYIRDLMKDDLAQDEVVYLEQLQASRETNVSSLTESRRKRVAEIDKMAKVA